MKTPSKIIVFDIGLHAVVVCWFIMLLRKAAASGIELTAVEFGAPVFLILALVLIVMGAQFLLDRKRN